MKIHRIHLNHFGKIKNLPLTFGDGIHVISGDNESGKSTLHVFLQAMLFGMERSRGRGARQDAYTRYQPWERSGSYGGVLELDKDGCRYSIYRNFEKTTQPCTLSDETHNRELMPTMENFTKLYAGLTPTLYANTISISQLKASIGNDLADELRNHIVNLHSSGSMNLDVTSALNHLKLEKKRQESRFSKEADQEMSEINTRIETLEQDLTVNPSSKEIPHLESEKGSLARKILRLGGHHQQLINMINRGEDSLKKYHIANEEEINASISEANNLKKEYEEYLEQYKKPVSGYGRVLYAFLAIIFSIGFFLGFWKTSTFLLDQNYLFAFLLFMGTALSATLAVRLGRRRDSAAAFRDISKRLLEIHQEHFEETPEEATPELIESMIQRLEMCQELFHTIQSSQESIRTDMETLLEAQNRLSEVNAKLDELRKESWQTEQKEEALRALEERREMLRDSVERNRGIQEEVAAIQLAIDTMQELSATVFDSFGFFLGGTASQVLSGITAGAYTGVFIDDDLNITLEQNHERVSLQQVSTGTVDQVYLAIRLACIEFLWPDQAMPLFLDDSFAMYDRERLTCTLQWLSENYSGQVFLFTCHQREGEILKAMEIPFTEVYL